MDESISSSNSCTPVHPRNSARKHNSRNGTFPPRGYPHGPEYKEDGQRYSTRNNGDNCSADDICRLIDTYVIANRSISKIVHSADGNSAEDTAGCDSPPGHSVVRTNGDKGSKEHNDRDEEGDCSKTARVLYLQLWLSVGHANSRVADEVLGDVSGYQTTPRRCLGHAPCTKWRCRP